MTTTDELIAIPTPRGDVAARFTAAAGDTAPARAVLLVGGADGGFDGPAEALYPTLAEDFATHGIATLRVDFRLLRFPNEVEEGVQDAIAGLAWLGARGARHIVLIGHSFGGAVVIESAVRAPDTVVGVVTLATQTAGAQRIAMLAPRPVLLIHGGEDVRLSPICSQMLHAAAGDPKELVILAGATHSLRQSREEVRARVGAFVWRVLEATG
ncbi:MAG: dienelactone hydrolase family protein [Chloroflexi bacterium]|nr:dienelactone hydrolase family protein [Chloroflexota bacterium]